MLCRAHCLSFVVGFDSAAASSLLRISRCFPRKGSAAGVNGADNRDTEGTRCAASGSQDQTLISASHNVGMFLLLMQKCK